MKSHSGRQTHFFQFGVHLHWPLNQLDMKRDALHGKFRKVDGQGGLPQELKNVRESFRIGRRLVRRRWKIQSEAAVDTNESGFAYFQATAEQRPDRVAQAKILHRQIPDDFRFSFDGNLQTFEMNAGEEID